MKRLLPLILLIPCLPVRASALSGNSLAISRGIHTNMNKPLKKSQYAAIIKGTVKDATGQTVPGVTVLIKGTTTGTQTDVNGAFSISANPGDVLVFTSVGYIRKEVTVVNANSIIVELATDARSLNEVVVTALGVKRSEKSLTYSTQQVSGSELTNVKTDNLVNALSGKIAGVDISPSASGIGGSSKVILRGNRSLDGNNQPLYVIDGVPISNSGNNFGQPNDAYGGNPEGGDGIGNLNPDDIESMTVLKGGPAAALYGSGAANGVIVIVTKKGKAGKTTINFSSSANFDHHAYVPQLQNQYGETSAGATTSFGPAISSAPNNLNQFFQTGNNYTNSLSMSGGSEIAQTYFSYTNTSARGIEPGNTLGRNNFDLHETAKFLNNKLTVDGNINFITQTLDNSPALGYYSNPLTGLYLFPRGMNIAPYKNYEGPDGSNNVPTQNWPFQEDIQQNPFWIINRNTNEATRNRILVNGSLKYEVNNWMSIQVRGSLDRSYDSGDQKYWAGTLAPLAAPNGNGSWDGFNTTNSQRYADAILNFNVPGKSDFKFDGLVGASITDNTYSALNFGPYPQSPNLFGLFVPNLFTIQNIEVAPSGAPNPYGSNVSGGTTSENQLQAAFASANLSYKDWVYLSLTDRVDWSSTLAYTPTEHYNYPSVGLSFILNQMFTLPQQITYAKIRGDYASVGNSPSADLTNPLNYANANSESFSTSAPYPGLKPEITKTYEGGLDMRLFNDRFSFSFTYYKTNTINQTIQVTPLYTSGYSSGYINAGNIQNKGMEITLGYDVIKKQDLNWNTTFNFSSNINKVIDVASKAGIDSVILTNSNSYISEVAKGGSFGDIYGQTLLTNSKGQLELLADGTPQKNGNFVKIANPAPKFQLGWNNNVTYHHFSLNFLVDGKFGGQVVSVMQSLLDSYGVSQAYASARAAGGVKVNGVGPNGEPITTVDAQTWYTAIGGRNAALGEYVYSATTVRLREMAFGYTLPVTHSVFKSFKLSLTGRNLIYFYRKAPFDPEITSSTQSGLGGVDIFNQPALRSYGLKLDVSL